MTSTVRGRPGAPIPNHLSKSKSPKKDTWQAWAFTVEVDGHEFDASECRFEKADDANLLRLVAEVTSAKSFLQSWSESKEPRRVTIIAGNSAGRPSGAYRISEATPKKYSLSWDVYSNKPLCEHLTLTFKDYSPEDRGNA